MKRPHPAPSFESLPPRRREGKTDIELNLQVTTPIFGGGPVLRVPGEFDLVRVPAIRGQLRGWWRALQEPATPADTRALHRRECDVWGGPADEGGGGRSPVELRVDVERPGRLRGDMLSRAQPEGQKYVLFPARGDKKSESVEVRCDVAFHLRLRLPAALEPEVLPALRAWILFGGYGGRTRRGLGSLTVVEEQRSEWLPKQATAKAIDALLSPSRKLLTAVRSAGNDTPSLQGAALWAGPEQSSAMVAWTTAAGWLWSFRQGHGENNAARQPPKQSDPNRPSISNWPEADKIRRLSRPPANASQWSHPPRHNEIPVWPRAGFGLPIIGQFQRKGRKGEPPLVEPPDFEIRWSVNSQPCDRLASPLILKALPLASGRHAPIALWLNRAWPAGGEVELLDQQRRPIDGSLAPFDRLVAPGDEPQFPALRGHDSLEAAFFAWLKANSGPSSATTSKNKPYKRSRR